MVKRCPTVGSKQAGVGFVAEFAGGACRGATSPSAAAGGTGTGPASTGRCIGSSAMTRCESDLLARNSLDGVVDVNDTKACARANLYKAVHDGISIVM